MDFAEAVAILIVRVLALSVADRLKPIAPGQQAGIDVLRVELDAGAASNSDLDDRLDRLLLHVGQPAHENSPTSLAEWLQHLLPSGYGGEDAIWVGGPGKGLGFLVVLGDLAVGGDLQVDARAEGPKLQPMSGRVEKTPSTALSQDALVGLKWKVQRGWWTS